MNVKNTFLMLFLGLFFSFSVQAKPVAMATDVSGKVYFTEQKAKVVNILDTLDVGSSLVIDENSSIVRKQVDFLCQKLDSGKF